MINFSARLNLISRNLEVFTQYSRGVERETLRYKDGKLAVTPHPQGLGSAHSNEWITTDFSESLLEFITPVSNDISMLLSQLEDVHHFTQTKLGEEKLWPLSMPCDVNSEDDINLAQYGSSNAAKMKTLYRKGLKCRYGGFMQIISGVHFNFSFPESFWDVLFGEQDYKSRQDSKSQAYFSLIRNYYRFGWLIPYFFGASPALCSSFIQGRDTKFPFKNIGQSLYLPQATSLRLSDLGYINSVQSAFKIGFNSLEQYLDDLDKVIKTPSKDFAKIGVKIGNDYRQLNSNVLQIENELYAAIRPKCAPKNGEKPSEALRNNGVEYIEVRSLDVNPYSPIGITEEQILFLDLFLTWAILIHSAPMDDYDLKNWRNNWNKVVIEGRKVGLKLQIGCHHERLTLQEWAKYVFGGLLLIAEHMDDAYGGSKYRDVCGKLSTWIDEPELTISGQLLKLTKKYGGVGEVGCWLGDKYTAKYLAHEYKTYSEQQMESEVARSWYIQAKREQTDTQSFDEYLNSYFAYLVK
ncbi:glutamate-cysteine ligase [Candidatus Photodesmus blepharus]|uniref:Glutamate--cysteine ligase n=1 Tax=Candidatus Photodesmus blepharonis TaxID=1179155 RepID=A0A084CP61_9GAMM|nr:glutamate--cysteine ligase [Candidatus Photodesmus blepharus]KEY91590.1 glutamate-cysteine ligase [Candidatus Photodesmus blepharus]